MRGEEDESLHTYLLKMQLTLGLTEFKLLMEIFCHQINTNPPDQAHRHTQSDNSD